jgi:hypothetical protein
LLSTTLVFAKEPVVGQVKTRISKTHGTELALSIYKELLSITALEIDSVDHHVAFAGSNDPASLKSIFPKAGSFFKQSGKELGSRLKNAFVRFFDKAYDGICAIGCDCPALSADDISQSFTLLERNDVVIGPAMDGGYYLIACKPRGLAVFNASAWGTNHLLEETIGLCVGNRLQYALLEKKFDIDTFKDFERWQKLRLL